MYTHPALLQWLSAQKMEGMHCHWVLAQQEYDFDITYCQAKLNANADTLLRRYSLCAITQVQQHLTASKICTAQQADVTLSKVLQALMQSDLCYGPEWYWYPQRLYRELWSQDQWMMFSADYMPSPISETVNVQFCLCISTTKQF